MGGESSPWAEAAFTLRPDLGTDGWLGIGWPKEYGGQDRSTIESGTKSVDRLPALPWWLVAAGYGVGLWIFALYVMAHLIAGLPAFLGFMTAKGYLQGHGSTRATVVSVCPMATVMSSLRSARRRS